MQIKTTTLIYLGISSLLVACGSTPDEGAQGNSGNTQYYGTSPKQQSTVTNPPALPQRNNNLGNNNTSQIPSGADRSIYFAFNKFNIEPQYQRAVKLNAQALNANPQIKILIQGNADERGSSEYNLALGQKRSNAVKRAMEFLGVPGNRIEAVSLGEEKPLNRGHNEAAWAENRRADILY